MKNTKLKNMISKKISGTKRIFSVAIIYLLFIMAHRANAAIVPKCDAVTGCTVGDFWKLFNNVVTALISVAVAFVTIVFIYAGYTYLTSGGDSGKVKRAHEMLKKAAVGFLIALIGYSLIFFILDILGFEVSFLSGVGI